MKNGTSSWVARGRSQSGSESVNDGKAGVGRSTRSLTFRRLYRLDELVL
jgi:hypothetical protein